MLLLVLKKLEPLVSGQELGRLQLVSRIWNTTIRSNFAPRSARLTVEQNVGRRFGGVEYLVSDRSPFPSTQELEWILRPYPNEIIGTLCVEVTSRCYATIPWPPLPTSQVHTLSVHLQGPAVNQLDSITGLSKLSSLDLHGMSWCYSHNPATHLFGTNLNMGNPLTILTRLTGLQELAVHDIDLAQYHVPSTVSQLTAVTSKEEVPATVRGLTKLCSLTLHHSGWDLDVAELTSLPRLRDLSFSAHSELRFGMFPPLPSLQNLYLDGEITDFQPFVNITALSGFF